MRKWVQRAIVIVPILVVGLGSGAARERVDAAGGSSTVEAVIDRYVQASGGAALAEIKTETRRGTLVRGQSGRVPFLASLEAPGKWHYNQAFAFGDQVSYLSDGNEAWAQDTRGVGEIGGKERVDLRIMFDLSLPLRIRDLFPDMKVQGVEKVGDRDAVVIRARTREGIETDLLFDRESGLLVRAGDLSFEDYRPAGSVKRPYRIFIGEDPAGNSVRLRMDVADIAQNVEVEGSLFSRPACTLPMKPSVLFKPRRQAAPNVEAMEACAGLYQHPTDPAVTYTVTRQQTHLMMKRTGWGQALEIKPESEWDYYIQFLNFEFHFVRDASGRVTALELGADRSVRAAKLK